ncbi:MAG: SPOR domain-containing protein [Candidatus Aminicenantes bacterium]|nr:SPOR domain-containing protein [Candidatus Aminicenantes bacterium]MCK5005199.1 SPOR domain-containing protein [Candidatus Aminicenantes bacterium]
MADNKSYLEVKVTFTHVIILLIAVIMIGIFLFYIGFNAGKNENMRSRPFRDISSMSVKSDEIRLDDNGADQTEDINIGEPDIKKELGLFDKTDKKIKPENNIKKMRTIKVPKSKSRDNYYSIQVGSFKSHLLAKNYAKKFALMGYQTDISQFQSGEILWFRVKVGNFETRGSANKEKSKLEKMEKKKFQTVKLN